MPEVRFEAKPEVLAILDGDCSANGIDRSKVIRSILRDWNYQKQHETTMILRGAGINPTKSETDRK